MQPTYQYADFIIIYHITNHTNSRGSKKKKTNLRQETLEQFVKVCFFVYLFQTVESKVKGRQKSRFIFSQFSLGGKSSQGFALFARGAFEGNVGMSVFLEKLHQRRVDQPQHGRLYHLWNFLVVTQVMTFTSTTMQHPPRPLVSLPSNGDTLTVPIKIRA